MAGIAFCKMPPCRVCRYVGPSHSYGEKLQNVISCHTHAPSLIASDNECPTHNKERKMDFKIVSLASWGGGEV